MAEPLILRDAIPPAPAWDVRYGLPSQPAPLDHGIGLDECWRIMRRRGRMIAGLVLSSVLITALVLSLLTPRYTAKSTLLIEPEPPQVLNVKQLIDGSASTDDHDYYKTQFELLKSRELAARVIDHLDLANNKAFNAAGLSVGRIVGFITSPFLALFGPAAAPRSPSEAKADSRYDMITHYLDGLKVEPAPGTRLVTVSYTAPDPHMAARIDDRHVHDYIQMGIDLRSQAGKSARDFLAAQLVQIGQRMQASEAALNSYRHQTGIIAFGVDEKNSLAAQRMGELNKALVDAETKRMTMQAEMKLVQAGDYESLPEVVANPAVTALVPEVRQLQAEYARLSAAFNPGYPKLDETKAQMDAAQSQLRVEIKDVAKAISRRYAAAADDEKRLQADIEVEKAKDQAIDDASLRDAVLVREVETNRGLYKNVLQRMEEMAVTEQAPLSNISIVDDAVVSRFPAYPRKLRDVSIVGLMSLIAGICAAFYAHQQDRRLYAIEEVEEFLGLQNLALVPDFERLGSRRWGLARLKSAAMPQLSRGAGASRASQQNWLQLASSPYAKGLVETYRMLRTSLLFSRTGDRPQTIMVSSAAKGEGKTFTAVNTAMVFAQAGTRTLLIDGDLRRPRCHVLLNLANSRGLSDLLSGEIEIDEAITETQTRNLSLMSAGSAAPNCPELLSTSRTRDLIRELSLRYDLLVIDTAPLMIASESCVIATMVDGILLVVGSQTPKPNIQRSRQRLEYVGAKILGVVFNRVNIHEPDHHEFLGYYQSYARTEQDSTL